MFVVIENKKRHQLKQDQAAIGARLLSRIITENMNTASMLIF